MWAHESPGTVAPKTNHIATAIASVKLLLSYAIVYVLRERQNVNESTSGFAKICQ